jgi:hypothetical protein
VHEFTRGCPKQRMDWAAGKKCLVDTISGLAFLHAHGIGHGGKLLYAVFTKISITLILECRPASQKFAPDPQPACFHLG